MADNRDPRKKSRTNLNRLTSSSNRAARSRASAADTPRPTSSANRSSRTSGRAVVTQSGARGQRRGAQGPRNPPVQGPSRRTRNITIGGNTGRPNPAPSKPNAVDRIGGRLLRQGLNNLGYNTSKSTTSKDLMNVFNLVQNLINRSPYGLVMSLGGDTAPQPSAPAGTVGQQIRDQANANRGKYNTMDSDGTVRSRIIIGEGKVGPKSEPAPTPKNTQLSAGARSFDKAFAAARKAGKSTFTWRGRSYNTKYKGE